MASGVFTPYSTSAEFFGTKPTWVPDELDVQRILSYQTYEQMYWNVPDIFKISLRGTNNLPIYVPALKTIVDTTNRFYGAGFTVTCIGEQAETVAAAQLALKQFMRREKFKSKYNGKKRYTLIHGDGVWHLTADADKPVGSRLRLTALDPGMYFPITDEDDLDRVVGCHLVELFTDDDGEHIRRLTYRKTERGTISVEDGIFPTDKWGGPEDKPERVIVPETDLPAPITSIPVYHTKNTEEPGNPFGSSEGRALERLISSLGQTMSDEDLALALMGIGLYATDASQPIDPTTKKPVPWQLGPGRVVHHDGTAFTRVPGVGDLAGSYGAHYDRLWQAIHQSSGTPEVAIGNVDVSIAQSGVALALQLSPMLAKSEEKNDLLLDTENQMFYDILTMWMPAYEETTFDGVDVECTVGSAVPVDREARFAELNDMYDRGIITTKFYLAEASKLGYSFPLNMDVDAQAEYLKRQAASDGFADRVDEEIGADDDGSTE